MGTYNSPSQEQAILEESTGMSLGVFHAKVKLTGCPWAMALPPLTRQFLLSTCLKIAGSTGFTLANPTHQTNKCDWSHTQLLLMTALNSGCPSTTFPVLVWLIEMSDRLQGCPHPTKWNNNIYLHCFSRSIKFSALLAVSILTWANITCITLFNDKEKEKKSREKEIEPFCHDNFDFGSLEEGDLFVEMG